MIKWDHSKESLDKVELKLNNYLLEIPNIPQILALLVHLTVIIT